MHGAFRFLGGLSGGLLVVGLCVGLCAACQPPAAGAASVDASSGSRSGRGRSKLTEGELKGIDTEDLTGRERQAWWAEVTELLAPCPDQPVSIAECVHEARPCASCAPAARFLLEEVKLGKTRAQIEDAFTLRFDPAAVHDLDLEGAPVKGARNAVVTIVEWADFQCPFCSLTAPYLGYLVKAYPDHVRVVFKHYPLSQHEYGLPAAKAAIAAQRQGRFWEMHDALYAHREELDEGTIRELAQQCGLDLERFAADMAAPATAARIEREQREADALGLRGTPMIYVNGRSFDLSHFDVLRDLQPWVALEIETATGQRVEPRVAAPALPAGPGADAPPGESFR